MTTDLGQSPTRSPRPPQVIIVGAGPSGLTLASELARFNVSYRLIDRSPKPAQWSQALVVQARTLEQFERYGIAEQAVSQGRKLHGATFFSARKEILHFAFDKIHSRYRYVLFLPQNETERLLADHLAEVGGVIEREVELADLRQNDEHVEADLRHADGQVEQVSANWIVGCDGAHSTVRHKTGIPFIGDSVDLVFFLGDLKISGESVPGDELRIYLDGGDIVFIGRLTDTVYRVIVALHEQQTVGHEIDAKPLAVADFQDALDRIVSAGMRVSDPQWMTRFRINQRKAKQYRSGRAFLCGDASHIHSPVAGQGMNTGIQDAGNLAWKIAAVENGAPESLLESYDVERGKVGATVVKTTSHGLTAALLSSPALESIRDHLLHWLGGFSSIQERATSFISETSINYRHSPIVLDAGGGSSLRAGDHAPDILLKAEPKEEWLYSKLSGPRHTLVAVDCSDDQLPPITPLLPAVPQIRLSSVSDQTLNKTFAANGEPLIYLIRPDGYIGMRGQPNEAEIEKYLEAVGFS